MGKPSVVIIEDEGAIAEAERLILEQQYNVHVANSAEAGFELIKKTRPSVVVLDWMLPGMSGLELCRRIHASKECKGTKIVMVTAKSQLQDEQKGIAHGADDYIMKPFEPVELLHVIKQVLA